MVRKVIKGTPSLVPAQNFDASVDAQACRAAMKGMGTNEAGLIEVLCKRTNEQRQAIARAFKSEFNRDLDKDVHSELSGDFRALLLNLLIPLPEFQANQLNEAMEAGNNDVVVETLCTVPNQMIQDIKDSYRSNFNKQLLSDLKSDVPVSFKNILATLLNGERDERGNVNLEDAQQIATNLYGAGNGRLGVDEASLNSILLLKNNAQLELIFLEYEKKAGQQLLKQIEKDFSEPIKTAYVTIFKCITDKASFFAEKMFSSKVAANAKSSQIIRLVVSRCEFDMEDIKKSFQKNHKKSLKDFIKSQTKGDFQKSLFVLIGEK